nr:histone H4 [Ipomoea batatas]
MRSTVQRRSRIIKFDDFPERGWGSKPHSGDCYLLAHWVSEGLLNSAQTINFCSTRLKLSKIKLCKLFPLVEVQPRSFSILRSSHTHHKFMETEPCTYAFIASRVGSKYKCNRQLHCTYRGVLSPGRDEHPTAHNILASETVQSPALPLEGVDDVHRRHGLPPSVLSVGHGVSDHILEEDFEDSPGLLVDEAGDTLHASSTSQTANGRLGNPLDVVAKHLPVTLGSSLAQSLASLSTA